MEIKELFKLIPCFYLPILIFLLQILILSPFNIYLTFEWLDIPMHFFGGFAIAYSFILVLRKSKDKIIIKDRFFEILTIIAFVGLIAILWELYEFTMGFIFTSLNWQLTLMDTLLDLFMGLIGGLTITTFMKIK